MQVNKPIFFKNEIVILAMLVSTILGNTIFDSLQIIIEFTIIIYLLYKNISYGLKRVDIFIFIILLITHLVSFVINPITIALLNMKLSLMFILTIIFFRSQHLNNKRLIYLIYFLNVGLILLQNYWSVILVPSSIIVEYYRDIIFSRPLGLFLSPHMSSTFIALCAIYLITIKKKNRIILFFTFFSLLLTSSYTALVAFIIWYVFYFLNKYNLTKYLANIKVSALILLIFVYATASFSDAIVDILKTIPNSRYYSFALMVPLLIDPDYLFAGISFIPNDPYEIIRYQEDIIGLAVGNESSLIKILIENGLILGGIILVIGFRNLNHIGVFLFITLLHYSYFFISPFILSMGIIINKEINNKTG